MEEEYNFTEEVFLDVDALDLESARQPGLFGKYAELWANACYVRDIAKQALEVKRAEVDLDIRMNPKDYGFDTKPTDVGIKARTTIHEEVIELERELIECVRDVNSCLGNKSSFEHKRSALNDLAKLYVTGYFGDVAMPTTVSEARKEEFHAAITEGLDKSLLRRKQGVQNGESK